MTERRGRDKRLTIISSGSTTWSGDGRLRGATDLPLSDDGRVDAQRRAARLARNLGICQGRFVEAPAVVRHPSDEAATETARIVAKALSARTRILEGLADANLGLLEGLTSTQFADRYSKRQKQWLQDPATLVPPEGEPIREMRARLLAAVSRLLQRSRTDHVALVLHPVALGLLRCWMWDRPTSDLWQVIESGGDIEHAVFRADRMRSMAEDAR